MDVQNNKLIEWTLDDVLGDIERISLVTEPAIQTDFMLFKHDKQTFKVVSNEKRIVTGVAMRPNINIPRVDSKGELYYGFFSETTVEKAAEMFFKKGRNMNDTNLEHQYDVAEVFVCESWLVKDPELDKSKALGLSDVRKGDWIVSMKVENDLLWNNFLKTGILKGFSVEIRVRETLTEQELFSRIEGVLASSLSEDEKFNRIEALLN